ncbi:TIGR02391 family protein [Mucilaginibacter puniceus]
MASKEFPVIAPYVLEGISMKVGDIMTGSEINKYLNDCLISNPTPDNTKWKRLYNAFSYIQHKTNRSNDILRFIQVALHPARFLGDRKDQFNSFRVEVNQLLSFIELEYGDDAVFRPVQKSKTINDAENRASTLINKLKDRNVHDDIFKFCKAELLVDNYFHAVFEATKSVADKLRALSDVNKDGGELIDECFAVKNPIIIINNFTSETEISEHKGFANLLKGFFGMFRNTVAHSPKISWEITEADALDIMTIGSLCLRKLDKAHKIR